MRHCQKRLLSLPLEREQGLLSFQVCCRSSSFPLDVYKETAEHGIPTGEALAPPPQLTWYSRDFSHPVYSAVFEFHWSLSYLNTCST